MNISTYVHALLNIIELFTFLLYALSWYITVTGSRVRYCALTRFHFVMKTSPLLISSFIPQKFVLREPFLNKRSFKL